MRWLICGCLLAACEFSTRITAPIDADVDAPDADPGPCRAVDIDANGSHVCVRRSDGEVWCWGRNQSGQIGVPTTGTCTGGSGCVKVPTKVPLPAGAIEIGLGERHTCALTTAKTYCWGDNSNGQFGNSTTVGSAAPIEVPARAAALAIRGGDLHTCSLHGTTIRCSGRNQFGEIGDMTTMQRDSPTTALTAGTATAIGLGFHHSCAVIGGGVTCWGDNEYLQTGSGANPTVTPTPLAGITNAVAVTGGTTHSCARLGDGTVRCWGRNNIGQLGIGDTSSQFGPVQPTVNGVTNIVAASSRTCALAGAAVTCWGEGYGNSPTSVPLPLPATAIAVGNFHDCAILSDGTVWCWRDNDYGQLGNNSTTASTTPVQAVVCP